MMLAGVLLASLAAGIAIANRLDRFRPLVGSASGLAGYTGVTVLAAVGSAFPARRRGARQREFLKISAAAACLLMLFAAVVMLSRNGVRLSLPAVLQRLV